MTKDVSYKTTAERILNYIRSGAFPAGSRIPVQKELAKTLNVSRGSVREAMIVLETQGHIQLRGRSGSYVVDNYVPSPFGLQMVTPLELTEARALFEAESAALAAPLMDDITIAELEKYIAVMSGHDDNQMSHDDADYAFHKTIARSTNNKMIIFVIESMWKIRTENKELQRIYRNVCDKEFHHREEEHLLILQAFKIGDSAAARRAMRAHFNRILEALIETSEKDAYEAIQKQTSDNRSRFLLSNQLS